MLKVIFSGGLTLFILFLLLATFPLVKVSGDSMWPIYKNGERLRGNRLYPRRRIKEGMVICYRYNDKVVLKRVRYIDHSRYGTPRFYCLGDNSEVSHDSRAYGYISSKRVVCVPFDQRPKINA